MDTILFWDDIPVGYRVSLGPRVVDREELLAFARRYDPQPFHVDERAAAASIYQGIIASGWQTAALAQAMLVEGFLGKAASLGSPGIDALRWRKPVRPGDELHLRLHVAAKDPSPKYPDRGSLDVEHEVENQAKEVVLSYRARIFLQRRGA